MSSFEYYQQELESVRARIIAITEGVQSYSIKDRNAAYADLQVLHKREAALVEIINRLNRGGIRVRGITKA